MAVTESKRFTPSAQHGKKSSATNPQPSAQKPRRQARQRTAPKKSAKRRRRVPALLKPVITKRGKTTIRSYKGRRFYRFEEIKGKTVDYVEIFLTADYHSIMVCFDDKTLMRFAVRPSLTLDTEHADMKTGNWRSIKTWPLIRNENLRQ